MSSLIAWIVTALASGQSTDASKEDVQRAVNKSLPLIQKSAAEYTQQRKCFSCHHQAAAIMAMTTARKHGFAVDESLLRDQLTFTEESLQKGRDRYREGRDQGGGATTAGYALWALELGGKAPDDTTESVVEFLLLRDKDRDSWKSSSSRPPSESSEWTSTFLALEGMKAFGTSGQKERVAERTAKARDWLLKEAPKETEDRVFRLFALKATDADEDRLAEAADRLKASQREDGGWSQTEGLESDAYATGSVLTALRMTGRIESSDLAFRKGLAYLIRTQLDDGSWMVHSRSKPFQTYFESGFPHGKDQFISMAATCWATAALALGVPETDRR